jgi:hypothetical protein
MTTDVSHTEPMISDASLADIKSFDDALALIGDVFGGEIVTADDILGTGFGIADEKAAYIGVRLVILKATCNLGDQGRFWSLMAVTHDGRKVIINDGGTGIASQMDELAVRHPEILRATVLDDGKVSANLLKPIEVRKGLRVSRYVHPEHGPAVTYYLDTSATV